jgi:hypothetical protein
LRDEKWKRNRGKNPDDDDDYQELDERKALVIARGSKPLSETCQTIGLRRLGKVLHGVSPF